MSPYRGFLTCKNECSAGWTILHDALLDLEDVVAPHVEV